MPFGFLRNRRSASSEFPSKLGSLKLKFASQMEALFDCRDSATAIAVSSWVSLSSFNASRESSIENLGMMPLFSSIRPCQVRYAATGNPKMYPCPTLYALPLNRRPGVFVPTMVARLFSSANAETISPALAVCSFTKSTTRPWNRCWGLIGSAGTFISLSWMIGFGRR